MKTNSNNFKNIVFIGYRGAGKSTFAKGVAKKIGYLFIQTDAEIERDFGCSISEFVATEGWKAFREKEKAILKKFSNRRHTVFDFGGGAILHQEVKCFKNNSVFVFIDVKTEVLIKRIKFGTNRPRLSEEGKLEEEVRATLKERLPIYRKYADITIRNNRLLNAIEFKHKVDEIIEACKLIK